MLALSLLVPQSLLTVQADSSTIFVHDNKAYDNPAFSEPLRKQNREDFSDGIKETPVSTLLAGSSSKNGEYCTTNEAVSNRIREFLVKREENYSIKVRLKIGNVKDSEKEDTLTKLMSSLFNAAFAETDKGYEGDYLEQILQGYDAQAAGLWED